MYIVENKSEYGSLIGRVGVLTYTEAITEVSRYTGRTERNIRETLARGGDDPFRYEGFTFLDLACETTTYIRWTATPRNLTNVNRRIVFMDSPNPFAWFNAQRCLDYIRDDKRERMRHEKYRQAHEKYRQAQWIAGNPEEYSKHEITKAAAIKRQYEEQEGADAEYEQEQERRLESTEYRDEVMGYSYTEPDLWSEDE